MVTGGVCDAFPAVGDRLAEQSKIGFGLCVIAGDIRALTFPDRANFPPGKRMFAPVSGGRRLAGYLSGGDCPAKNTSENRSTVIGGSVTFPFWNRRGPAIMPRGIAMRRASHGIGSAEPFPAGKQLMKVLPAAKFMFGAPLHSPIFQCTELVAGKKGLRAGEIEVSGCPSGKCPDAVARGWQKSAAALSSVSVRTFLGSAGHRQWGISEPSQ
jgi:hypothetical protein